MSTEMQKKIMKHSKLIMMPCFRKNNKKSIYVKELSRCSQDLALCIGNKFFFESLMVATQ